jgi:hypothetical protein
MSPPKRVSIRFAVLSCFIGCLSTVAFSQVRQWRDQNGTIHFEAGGPAHVNSGERGKRAGSTSKMTIDRRHAGLTLGDDESAFKAEGRAIYIGKSGPDENYYEFNPQLPPGAAGARSAGALFVTGRLVLIAVEYTDAALSGWENLVKQTSEKYGPPGGDARFATWNDGATALSFTREPNGNITAIVNDHPTMSKQLEQDKNTAPKF